MVGHQTGEMELDSGLLRAFVAAAEEQHFGRAAARLSLTQQGLSKRIRRLEADLAVELFRRTTRSVELTDVGVRFLAGARQAVDAVDAAIAVTRSDRRPLRVASLDERLTPLRLLRQALVADPGLSVDVVTNIEIDDVLSKVRTGDVDVSFGWARWTGGPWPADIRRRLMAVDRLELLVPAAHPLAVRGTGVRIDELSAFPLWFPSLSAPQGWMAFLAEWVDAHGLTLETTTAAPGFAGFLDTVAGGKVSVYGSGMPSPNDPRLTRLPLLEPVPLVTWWILWRRTVADAHVARLIAAIGTAREATVALEALDPSTVWVPVAERAALEVELDRRLSEFPSLP